ncbi:MAG: hypothetical protein ACTSYA_12045 [Candidatus Kariarchaeaceae archaeon]
MFMVNNGYELLSTSAAGGAGDGQLFKHIYATMIKDVDETVPVETQRRRLFLQMEDFINNNRANISSTNYDMINHEAVDVKTWKKKLEEKFNEFNQKLLVFLESNEKFRSVIKEHKRKNHGTIQKFVKLNTIPIKDRLIDSEKIKEFELLQIEAEKILNFEKESVHKQVISF